MPRQKSNKPVRYKVRRQSYIRKATADAAEWRLLPENKDLKMYYIVDAYLQDVYKITITSSQVRKINGVKINRTGTWRVRVDYMLIHDVKMFLLFTLRYSPIIIDKSWFELCD